MLTDCRPFRRTLFAGCVAFLWPAAAMAQEGDLPRFAEDVTLHVVAHEIGHALIREFDLPILTREEIMAEDFATLLILDRMPEDAPRILEARIRSLLLEDDRESLFSVYDDDARRAGAILCLAAGLAPGRFETLTGELGMTGDDLDACRETAPEIARGWRRLTAGLHLPPGVPVNEAGLRFDDAPLPLALAESPLAEAAYALLSAFDWHSYVTLHFAACDGTAGWRRNGRVITICDAYIARFAAQAETIGTE